MNIGEVLDSRAAEGSLGSVTLIRVGKLWQVYITSAATGSVVARREPTPSQSIEAALNLLPFSEDYDRKHGLARINESKIDTADDMVGQYKADYAPLSTETIAAEDRECAELFKNSKRQTVESEQPPGVFD